jgi:hypothetical protein
VVAKDVAALARGREGGGGPGLVFRREAGHLPGRGGALSAANPPPTLH